MPLPYNGVSIYKQLAKFQFIHQRPSDWRGVAFYTFATAVSIKESILGTVPYRQFSVCLCGAFPPPDPVFLTKCCLSGMILPFIYHAHTDIKGVFL